MVIYELPQESLNIYNVRDIRKGDNSLERLNKFCKLIITAEAGENQASSNKRQYYSLTILVKSGKYGFINIKFFLLLYY